MAHASVERMNAMTLESVAHWARGLSSYDAVRVVELIAYTVIDHALMGRVNGVNVMRNVCAHTNAAIAAHDVEELRRNAVVLRGFVDAQRTILGQDVARHLCAWGTDMARGEIERAVVSASLRVSPPLRSVTATHVFEGVLAGSARTVAGVGAGAWLQIVGDISRMLLEATLLLGWRGCAVSVAREVMNARLTWQRVERDSVRALHKVTADADECANARLLWSELAVRYMSMSTNGVPARQE